MTLSSLFISPYSFLSPEIPCEAYDVLSEFLISKWCALDSHVFFSLTRIKTHEHEIPELVQKSPSFAFVCPSEPKLLILACM